MNKRVFDVFVASVALVLCFPLFVVIWLTVVLTSGRPGLFSQTRVGKNGRHFTMYKFRTMTHRKGADKGDFDVGDSRRVTAVGRLLRKSKLDELPQLVNVLRGDMSLVGPRPEVPQWIDAYPERWNRVLTVRPGITDPASIVYRNEEEMLSAASDPDGFYRDVVLPRKLDLYERYVASHSMVGDVYILLKTLVAIVMKRTHTEMDRKNDS